MLEEYRYKTRLQGGWSQAIETFVTPEGGGCSKSIAKDNLHARIEAAT